MALQARNPKTYRHLGAARRSPWSRAVSRADKGVHPGFTPALARATPAQRYAARHAEICRSTVIDWRVEQHSTAVKRSMKTTRNGTLAPNNAWVSRQIGLDVAVKTAADWLRENGTNYGKRALLIPLKGELSGAQGALGDYIANGNIGSEKGKQADRGGPVLALGPTLKLLDTAIRTADGQPLAIVEHIPNSLDGWAAATGAINLATGESTPRVPDEIEALVDLQREGDNGYPTPRKGTSYGIMVKSLIAKLKEHGYSGEFVATYLVALGLFGSTAENLLKIYR
jgi:hypothetical protein